MLKSLIFKIIRVTIQPPSFTDQDSDDNPTHIYTHTHMRNPYGLGHLLMLGRVPGGTIAVPPPLPQLILPPVPNNNDGPSTIILLHRLPQRPRRRRPLLIFRAMRLFFVHQAITLTACCRAAGQRQRAK